MSNAWIRGSRCGVDNCRSKFYRSIDGQRVCQYGHVREAYLEINDEEDDAGQYVVTRRLTQLNKRQESSKGKSTKMLYGSLGRVVYHQALQHLLRLQVQAMIERHGAPRAFEPVVRRIWGELLRSRRRTPSAKSPSVSESDYSAAGSESEPDTNADDCETRKPPGLLTLKYTLAVLYVACRELSLPVYIDDLLRWVLLGSLPYLGLHILLPKGLQQKLTAVSIGRLTGARIPVRGELCSAVIILMNCMSSPVNKFNPEPLMFRAITKMILPPQIYPTTKKLIKKLNVTFEYKIRRYIRFSDSRRFPETQVLAAIITATKLYFAQPYINPSKQTCDYKTWKLAFDQINQPNGQTERGMLNTLTQMAYSKDINKDLVQWDDSIVDQYCDWVTETVSKVKHPDPESYSIGLKRLFNIFTMPEENDTPSVTDRMLLEEAYKKVLESKNDAIKEGDSSTQAKEMLAELESTLCEYVSRSYGVEIPEILAAVRLLGASCGV